MKDRLPTIDILSSVTSTPIPHVSIQNLHNPVDSHSAQPKPTKYNQIQPEQPEQPPSAETHPLTGFCSIGLTAPSLKEPSRASHRGKRTYEKITPRERVNSIIYIYTLTLTSLCPAHPLVHFFSPELRSSPDLKCRQPMFVLQLGCFGCFGRIW